MNERKITLDEANTEKFNNFFRVYEFETGLTTGDLNSITYIGSKEGQRCRYCDKTMPEVKFSNDAHVIPQFLGNRYLLSYFECNECNKTFSLYEKDFSSYLGAYRSFSFVTPSKYNKYPKHKEETHHDNEKDLKLSIQQTGEKSVEVKIGHQFDDLIEIDRNGKRLAINATTQSYIPIYVYKMLVKIAISLISDDEIEFFKNTKYFLLDNTQNEKFKDFGLCRVYIHAIYGPIMFRTPTAFLYRKKKELEHEAYLSKVFILNTSNHIYQVFIPFNEQDKGLLGQKVTPLHFPLPFDISMYQNGITYKSYSELMSGHEKVKRTQRLSFSFGEGEFFDEKDGKTV